MLRKTADLNSLYGFTNIVFADNFVSEALDEAKWNIHVSSRQKNFEEQTYINAEETVYILQKDGSLDFNGHALALHPRYRPDYQTADGKAYDFISGRVDTIEKFNFTYGLISARMKLPSGQGLWPALWLLGSDKWPECGEIDIMENVGDPIWFSSGVHGPGYSGDAGLINSYYLSEMEDSTSWHVYSAAWSPDKIDFYFDDILVNRLTKPMVNYYGQWAFDNRKHIIINFAIGGNYPHKINGNRSPYFGLPQKTVDEIKKDRIRFLVDWIKVYQ